MNYLEGLEYERRLRNAEILVEEELWKHARPELWEAACVARENELRALLERRGGE